MEIQDIIQLSALGILGVVVIAGFSLFKWAVQKFLPSYVTTIKDCTKDICGSLHELTDNAKTVQVDLKNHDTETKRFDSITKDILDDISHLSNQQNNVIKILDRQTVVLEKITDNMAKK